MRETNCSPLLLEKLDKFVPLAIEKLGIKSFIGVFTRDTRPDVSEMCISDSNNSDFEVRLYKGFSLTVSSEVGTKYLSRDVVPFTELMQAFICLAFLKKLKDEDLACEHTHANVVIFCKVSICKLIDKAKL